MPQLLLSDKSGKVRFLLAVDGDSTPVLTLRDRNGKASVTLDVPSDGSPGGTAFDRISRIGRKNG